MQLTKFTDYSLRTLTYLALIPEGELCQVNDICIAYNISKNHLIKVVQLLSNEGIIDSVRGKGGGIRLAKKAEDINIGSLVRITEKNLKPFNCSEPVCVISGSCVIPSAFSKAVDAYFSVLDTYSLKDFIGPKADLRNSLKL